MVNHDEREPRMTDLRHQLVGGWLLESAVSRDGGTERRPFGEHPTGLILYTPDGYMSAQLTAGPGAEYIAYTGRFHVDERSATVHHDVLMSTRPELLTSPQFRQARVDGDRLTLSANATSDDGTVTHSTLVWRRT
jgi:Lipocalin-like domain